MTFQNTLLYLIAINDSLYDLIIYLHYPVFYFLILSLTLTYFQLLSLPDFE